MGRERLASSLVERPDRVALWAVVLAIVAMVAGAVSAQAGSTGGAGFGSGGSGPDTGSPDARGCLAGQLGDRKLRRGDCGDDVATLNWILKSKQYRRVSLAGDFDTPTESAVRDFERNAGVAVNGVVERATVAALVKAMPSQIATWYGPGFWGNRTACGEKLKRGTVGVAHKSLPCGSKVVLRYQGRFLRTRVIDRGPYANHAKWDLTQRAARMLGFEHTDEVRVAKLAKGAKRRG